MIEWTVATVLRTSLGDLAINAASGARYLLDQAGCEQSRTLRVTSDPVPEGDGEVFHRRFADGTQIDLRMQLWMDDAPACGSDAREMYEDLAQHLSAILNDGGRYLWTPTDYGDQRMMDEARWMTPIRTTFLDGGVVQLEFSIDSPFPYFIDGTQESIALVDGVPTVVTNDGNADFYPVILVDGPATDFTIANATSGLQIVYSSARPGAQALGSMDFAEIDTYRNTVYLNGDEDNLKPGVDPEETDYFVVLPDANTITITGADATLLLNNAWLP